MAQSWTLFVKGFDQKNMKIEIPGPHPEVSAWSLPDRVFHSHFYPLRYRLKSTKVSAFKTKIQEKTGLNPQYQLLKLEINKDKNSMQSIYDDSKRFSEYPSITNGSQFLLLLQTATRHIDPFMKRSNGPCLVTYTEYETPECILAPCGHPVHPDDLMAYCQAEVFDQKKWEIRCMKPGCNVEWPLSFISKSGATTYEYELLEKGLSENHCIMNQCADIHQCPSCNCFCERIDKSQCRMRCWWCTKRSGKAYDFCWHCLASWIGDHNCPQKKGA